LEFENERANDLVQTLTVTDRKTRERIRLILMESWKRNWNREIGKKETWGWKNETIIRFNGRAF
jgi:hypothetical protein